MQPLRGHCPYGRTRRHHQAGFTLFETILVIGVLALVSAGIASMQPSVFKTQTTGRDEFVGVELMRACAERVLAVRRHVGYVSVSTGACSVIAGVGGFSSPTVALADANGNSITTCSTATCTATIKIAKSTDTAEALPRFTLQLTNY